MSATTWLLQGVRLPDGTRADLRLSDGAVTEVADPGTGDAHGTSVLDAALPKSDVVMMLRVQAERMNASFFPSAREYSRRYGLDAPGRHSAPPSSW